MGSYGDTFLIPAAENAASKSASEAQTADELII